MPPIAAVREGSVLPASRFAAHSAKTGIGVLGGVARRDPRGDVRRRRQRRTRSALLLAGGVLGLFAAIALLAPRLVKPITRVVGWPARRAGGVAGELAGANAVRNPSRTASTAAALMIGLTLVTVVAVLGSGISAGTKSAIKKQVHADYVIDGKEGLPFRAAEGDKLAAIPGRDGRVARPLGRGDRAGQADARSAGSTPRRSRTSTRSTGRAGADRTLAQLGADGALVTETYAKDKHLKVGSDVVDQDAEGREPHGRRPRHLRPARGQPAARRRRGDAEGVRLGVRQPKNSFTFLDADAGSAAAIKAAAKGYGDAKLPHRRRVSRRTPPRTWPWSWACSTCCWASRSS